MKIHTACPSRRYDERILIASSFNIRDLLVVSKRFSNVQSIDDVAPENLAALGIMAI